MLSQEGPFTLSIPNGGTDSPALSTAQGISGTGIMATIIQMLRWLSIKSPAALTGAVTLQGATSVGGADWTTLRERGSDIAVAAGKTDMFEAGGWKDLRIHSAGAEGAQRDFSLMFGLQR